MELKELRKRIEQEIEQDEKRLVSTLLCIRISADSFLKRIDNGEKVESCELEFEFSGKIYSAEQYALRIETLRKLMDGIEG